MNIPMIYWLAAIVCVLLIVGVLLWDIIERRARRKEEETIAYPTLTNTVEPNFTRTELRPETHRPYIYDEARHGSMRPPRDTLVVRETVRETPSSNVGGMVAAGAIGYLVGSRSSHANTTPPEQLAPLEESCTPEETQSSEEREADTSNDAPAEDSGSSEDSGSNDDS